MSTTDPISWRAPEELHDLVVSALGTTGKSATLTALAARARAGECLAQHLDRAVCVITAHGITLTYDGPHELGGAPKGDYLARPGRGIGFLAGLEPRPGLVDNDTAAGHG